MNFKTDQTKGSFSWPKHVLVKRVLWDFFLKKVFMLLPVRANFLRVTILRVMGAKIGKGCVVSSGVDVLMPWNLELDDFVAIGLKSIIYNYAEIKVGALTTISQFSFLCTGTHDYSHPYMPLTWEPITIGSECWIAAESFIAPGVSIANGAVIGARSVVTRDVPEWMVCAGNPCRPIKPRVVRDL